MGKLSVGATFQLGGKFGVGYSGGTRNAILISLTSPSSLALPHIALPCFERVDPVNATHWAGIAFPQVASGDLDCYRSIGRLWCRRPIRAIAGARRLAAALM